MSNAVLWGGLALSLLVILLVAARLLKQPCKKKSAKKTKRHGKTTLQKTKTQQVVSGQTQPRRKELFAMEGNLKKNKVMAQVMIVAREDPERVSKVLRQWMKKG